MTAAALKKVDNLAEMRFFQLSGIRGVVTECKLLSRLLGDRMMDDCGPTSRTRVQPPAKALQRGIQSEVQL